MWAVDIGSIVSDCYFQSAIDKPTALTMATKTRRTPKLPVQQLAILAAVRFAEPISCTSLFPYLPSFLLHLGIPQNQLGSYTGLLALVFSLCQALTGIPWGRASDHFGRKPMILIALVCTMLATIVWGFSTSLTVAVAARIVAGLANGDVGIIRTTVAELVPEKELQPRAFSVMPMLWSVGSILGPSMGGLLANPYNVKPGEGGDSSNLLKRYPFALPNLVSGAFFLVGAVVGLLYLEETLETKKNRRDYGRILGSKLTGLYRRIVSRVKQMLHPNSNPTTSKPGLASEADPLLRRDSKDEEHAFPPKAIASRKPVEQPPSFREVLTPQACLNLLFFTLLAAHSMAFDQLLPVFMQYPTLSEADSVDMMAGGNLLHFAAGFALPPRTIGLLLTTCGVLSIFVQFLVFPPTCRRYGPLRCLRICACIYPVIYFLVPLTALLPSAKDPVTKLLPIQVWACLLLMLARSFVGTFAFPCCFILLTNSATSLKGLGTLNGMATSLPAIGRAAGPMFAGAVFSLGVQRGYMIAPWWLLAGMSVLGAIPTIFQVEGKGFVKAEEADATLEDNTRAEANEDDVLRAEGFVGAAEAAGDMPSPLLSPALRYRDVDGVAAPPRNIPQLSQRD